MMTHQHLCFQSLHGLKCHTNNDDDRRTANAERRVADDDADENRHNCHDCKIQSAKERDLVDAYRKNKALQPCFCKQIFIFLPFGELLPYNKTIPYRI